ncbi:MAG TPA: ATP-binding protein [Streptosporangiaceae bacterium]|nr:ATP-binding protein [Streptosporangiaceae bacterium]
MALEICAAGRHHLSLLGPPGTGTTMLAERLPTILPGLDAEQALEATAIHSAGGALPDSIALLTAPPFVAPHRSVSRTAVTGGGNPGLRPGAASLAHRGILFLHDAPDFSRDVLDALRQPLEAGQITIARSGITATFPARFILVLAASPCPCAKTARAAGECSCAPAARQRYLGRLSGPLLDRIEVKPRLQPHRAGTQSRGHVAGGSQTAADDIRAARPAPGPGGPLDMPERRCRRFRDHPRPDPARDCRLEHRASGFTVFTLLYPNMPLTCGNILLRSLRCHRCPLYVRGHCPPCGEMASIGAAAVRGHDCVVRNFVNRSSQLLRTSGTSRNEGTSVD